ncbi:signal recognition particle, SRP19 subunit [Mycena filopes]|nr:signal recognition particle, SRP19 subunit [Mycena filopes]
MSRRAAVVEEEFDDDTDLPLPSHPLPNTGTSGPLIQEMYISDDELDPPPSQRAGPASPPSSQPAFRPPPGMNRHNTVTDITPYKNWTCIYPIYIDAKRSYGTGQRRVQRANAVWWPLSQDITEASMALGLAALHEVGKSHPRDWENPGRVRVQWKKDGRLMNPMIKTKKLLLEAIAARIQTLKPQSVPVPPFYPTSSPSSADPTSTPPPASGKGKQTNSAPAPKSKTASKSASSSKTPAKPAKAAGKEPRPTPAPPHPHPPLAQRVSPYSPALASGVLVDAVKAGMAAQAQEAAAAAAAPVPGQQQVGQGGAPGAGQKGKKKVIRVRG